MQNYFKLVNDIPAKFSKLFAYALSSWLFKFFNKFMVPGDFPSHSNIDQNCTQPKITIPKSPNKYIIGHYPLLQLCPCFNME